MLASVRRRLGVRTLITALFATLFVATPQTAQAAESIPELQWPATQVSGYGFDIIAAPSGEVTTSCATTGDPIHDLRSYNNTGQLVRELSNAEMVDDVRNCIRWPVIDANGDLYGIPSGQRANGSYGPGPNLLAYNGNTLKWRYPTGCHKTTSPTVGADGNIYFVGNGRLIGLTPDVQPPLTTPAKILDVPAGISGCAEYMVAFEDGIAVVKDLYVKFFSYSGTGLGGPLGNAYANFGIDQISETGRFFYDTYLSSGGLRSAQVSAYDYGRKEVMWTTTVSGNGAYVRSASPYATPDGGTLVSLREKETNEFGEFTNRDAYSLIKLNALGIKQWSKTLPLSDIAGNKYHEGKVRIDTNGNIAIARRAELRTSEGRLANAVSIAVFSSSGDVVYADTLHGNLDEDAGQFTGYRLSYSEVEVAPDTLYVTADQCNGTYCGGDTKFFPIEIPGLGLDYPRGTVYDTVPRPSSAYIALGDSFSSGEGVEPFEADTDIPNWNKCHRSELAYARLLVQEHGAPSLGSDGFRACSGAVTTNVTDAPQWNEGIQLDLWPDPTTELVTVTIGGNDIGFADFAEDCVYPTSSCDFGTSAYNSALGKINNDLPAKLEETYKRILKYAPNAEIYVVGYPHVVANKSESSPADSRCFYMQGGSSNWGEARAARAIVTALNDTIEQKVNDVRALDVDNARLHFIEMDGSSSPFNGHEVCGTASTSWFQNIDQATNDPAYVFHPNSLGQDAYATVVGAAIDAS